MDVDVVVHHRHLVEILQRGERSEDGIALVSIVLRALLRDLHDEMEPVEPAGRDLHVGDDRDRSLQRPQRGGLEHVLAQHDRLASRAVDGEVDRIESVGDRIDGHDRGRSVGRVVADELRERALVHGLGGRHTGLEHDFALGWDP